jgi:endonuclease III
MAGNAPEQLAAYISSLSNFVKYTEIDGNYSHVGATLADAVLQSNNDYERNVRRRIARIRTIYAGAPKLSDLKRLLLRIKVQEFLDWKGTRKLGTFLDLVDLLQREVVDTEDDLRQWLSVPDSREKLLAIRFIGPKTADYLKILVGLPVAAMDRHLLGFLELAGLGKLSYPTGQDVVHKTADLMQLDRAHLDHSIWRYMSSGKASAVDGMPCCPTISRRVV